jgi:hypothetical protein
MPDTIDAFAKKREALLQAADKESNGTGLTKQVAFSDGPLVRFLKDLKQYQSESRKFWLIAK